MLDILLDQSHSTRALCQPLSRRKWLSIGGVTGLSSMLSGSAQADKKPAVEIPGFGKAKSVIVVFASGGQSQIDTWDPKPHAPKEVRGKFSPIQTSVPGTFICEHMPRIAKIADKFTIVRSMSHADLDHGSACYLSLTGQYHQRRSSNPDPSPNDRPSYAAIYKHLKPNAGFAEPAIHINGPLLVPIKVSPAMDGGLLGRDARPMILGNLLAAPVVMPGLSQREDLPQVRLNARKSLLEQLDQESGRLENDASMLDLDTLYGRAFEMLKRPETRNAFKLEEEPEELRRRYGMNRSGQACLLARRLVEAGVPMTTVFFNQSVRGQDTAPENTDAYGWDTHNDIFMSLEDHLLPRFDLAFSALLEDLEQRGLLDETLVLCMGEFGRAPLIALEKNFVGSSPGRKHWSFVYSIVAAGAGVSRGKILGQSNRIGAYPVNEKFAPWDVTATIFSALGVNPAGHFTDSAGRPFPISGGKVISGLYSG
jgi:hypothetical protein